jgi:epoxide hydrolase-like predicted phosphatase
MKLSEGLLVNISEVKNIIFDWGGVITDLNLDSVIEAFKNLGYHHFDEAFTQDMDRNYFLRFETGKIQETEFLKILHQHLNRDVTDQQILEAWYAILGDLPAERWTILTEVKKTYRIFLLSNTNSLHVSYYSRKLEKQYGKNGFERLFEKVYYSHQLGMRKPDRNIFKYVLQDSRLVPHETFFIDDNPENITAAREFGIIAYHLAAPATLTDIFAKESRV